jgi:CRP-like cAMP-binding protein
MNAHLKNQFDLFRRTVEQFVAFNEEEWAIFQSHLKVLSLKKKDFFVQAEEVCNYIGFIVSGSVRFFYIKDGAEITGYFSLENELICSNKSFITRQPGLNSIEALEKTELVVLSYSGLQQLMENDRLSFKMERFGRLIGEYLICCYEDRISSFITQTPEERYIDLLSKSSNVIQRIPQYYIANYLGITPVSLSRIRRRIMAPSKELRQVLS